MRLFTAILFFFFFDLVSIIMLQALGWFMLCRSSAVPKKVEILDGMHVIRLVFGLTMSVYLGILCI